MSNISDRDLDRLFKEAAEHFKTPFDDQMWEHMDNQLSSIRKVSGFTYYKAIGVTLVSIIVLLALLVHTGSLDTIENKDQNLVAEQQNTTDGAQSSRRVDDGPALSSLSVTQPTQNTKKDETANKVEDHKNSTPKTDEIEREIATTVPKSAISVSERNLAEESANQIILPQTEPVDLAAQVKEANKNELGDLEESIQDNSGTASDKTRQQKILTNKVLTADLEQYSPDYLDHIGLVWEDEEPIMSREFHTVDEGQVEQESQKKSYKGGIALKLAYSPDMSSVGYFSPDAPGYDIGILGEYNFANRWFISAGAILSQKKYYSDESNALYGDAPYPVNELDASCKVIDIPVNVGFRVFQHDVQGLYVSAGLSSYVMLSEDYKFSYYSHYGSGTWEQNYKNENNHFLGIANISVGYERRIKNNLFIQLEPFLKAPIVGVGEGKVDLVSTGAFLALKYQLKKR